MLAIIMVRLFTYWHVNSAVYLLNYMGEEYGTYLDVFNYILKRQRKYWVRDWYRPLVSPQPVATHIVPVGRVKLAEGRHIGEMAEV